MSPPRRTTASLLAAAVALATALLGLPAAVGSAAESAPGAPTTVAASSGPFQGLAVTVSQTSNLINQVVTVTWQGGAPTVPSSGRFGTSYLQIMQCWGDSTGPTRERCQYGARLSDSRGGAYASSRQVNYGELVDPKESLNGGAANGQNVFVPFESATGKTSTGSRSEFFDSSSTNELAFARTRADGTGRELFEMQTSTEAPGLGCGGKAASGTLRSCYLVAVPRGATEVDTSSRNGSGATELQSSPLSQSNWDNRLVVPLSFEPIGGTCPQTGERRTVGHALVSELITRWQPALCSDGGATYGFSQVTDAFARNQLTAADPGLSFLTNPADPSATPADGPPLYAPVAVEGLAIGFLVERVPVPSASPEQQLRGGSSLTELKLTPRLVAKLLTQSYGNAVPDRDPAVTKNPELLSVDPEFVALNPEFSKLVYTQLSDLVVPVGQADVITTLWQWIAADPQARAWLDGAPDEAGMVVNPAYRGLVLPVADFPKNDPYCRSYLDDRLPLCAIERRPYAADLNEAGRAAARGDNLARQFWDPLATPPAWRRADPQPNGSRAVLAVTDTATASRYGLVTASLRNAAGAFVAADASGLAAGVKAMTPGRVTGTLVPDPTSKDPAAYPLTTVSYAATVPARLTAEAGAQYAALLDYAAGPGQAPGVAPGTLPGGYLPLPATLRTQLSAAAVTLRATAGKPVVAPAPSGPAAAGPGALPDGAAPGGSDFLAGGGSSGVGPAPDLGGALPPVAVEPPGPLTAAVPAPVVAAPVALAYAGSTPVTDPGSARWWLPSLLVLGILAGLLGRLLSLLRPGGPPPR